MNELARARWILSLIGAACLVTPSALADDLFKQQVLGNIASDHKSTRIGDVLTVVVYQAAEARNAAQNSARKRRSIEGGATTPVTNNRGAANLSGEFLGSGEVRRSETFTTQMSVTILNIYPNGDLAIAGEQRMTVNGEESLIRVSGRVRPVDITADNRVLSSRIADAVISYDGKGFASRNANSGFLGRFLSAFGFAG